MAESSSTTSPTNDASATTKTKEEGTISTGSNGITATTTAKVVAATTIPGTATAKAPIVQPNIFKHESSLAPFNPTCNQAQGTTLRMLNLTGNDVLFDLGCGDGRMLLHAATNVPGLRCVGIELDPTFVQRGRDALSELPIDVQTRVDIRHGDLLQLMNDDDDDDKHQGQQEPDTTSINNNHSPPPPSSTTTNTKTDEDNNQDDENNDDTIKQAAATEEKYRESILGKDCRDLSLFGDATALYMFLLPKGIKKIQGLLNALVQRRQKEQRSFHVIAYMFSIREWDACIVDKTTKGDAPLYLYRFGPPSSQETQTKPTPTTPED